MRLGTASDFEWRNPGLLRAAVLGCAIAAYAIDHDDLIWAMASWHTRYQQLVARCLFAGAALLLCLAEALRSWTRAYETPNCNYEFDPGTAIWRADGPFRHLREPMALGDAMFVLGISSMLSRTGVVIATLGFAILLARASKRRECELQSAGRSAYRGLCDHVPHFFLQCTLESLVAARRRRGGMPFEPSRPAGLAV